ncbi:GNAT family N-acetyltransferase [Pseudoduganella sp.]|uniref:GNAT family N-acetyltransferase n=1 Tax=Pseudoduganella sp. TaxID=1880898 RepID=UPI0035B43FFE
MQVTPSEITTERLRLRQWTPGDYGPFAAINADPRVMEFFPSVLTRQQSDAMADRCSALIRENGWGPWVAELKDSRQFIGLVGLQRPRVDLPFSPCVEVLWRLAFDHWGKGYASEAAKAAIGFGFQSLGLTEIVSFTALCNSRSRAVMERLGMQASGSFEHPALPDGHPLKTHCLYRLGPHPFPI